MSCGPKTQISPTPFSGNSRPASSRMDTSVDEIGSPIDPLKSRSMGLMHAAGEVSVNPHAWVRMLPVTFFQRSATTPCTAMPPPSVILSAEKSSDSKPGVCSSALKRVFTPLMKKNLYFLSSATNAGKSRGFAISTFSAPRRANSRQFAVNEKM